MSRPALRGATWVFAAGLAMHGIAGFVRILGVGGLALMPSAGTAVTIGTGVLIPLVKVGVAVFVLSRLRRATTEGAPPWLVLVLLIAFGLTGAVMGLGSAWAQGYVFSRTMGSASYAEFAMTQGIVSGIGGLLNPLIDIGTLVAAAWLWQSQSKTEQPDAAEQDASLPNDSPPT